MSDHFDGRHYFNPTGARRMTLRRLWRFLRLMRQEGFRRVPVRPSHPPRRVEDKVRATWVGHSTLLLQVPGLNLLTDPIWSARAGPFPWTGPKRAAAPGVRFQDLPPIHLVLVSHNHYDHMDSRTLKRLHRVHAPRFCVPKGNARLLYRWGIDNVVELDWWEGAELDGVQVHCAPAQHFCRRWLNDANEALWSGWVVDVRGWKFYFAGDTGYFPGLAEIGRRFGPIALAALPIGAYAPRSLMQAMHLNPEEAVKAHLDLRAEHSLAIHHNTFRMTIEPQDEPPVLLRKALEEHGLGEENFWILPQGGSREIPWKAQARVA